MSGGRWILGIAALALAGQARAMELYAIGDAYDRRTGEPVYREIHCEDPGAERRVVAYEGADGGWIAYKKIDYSTGRSTPSFEQHNLEQARVVALDFDEKQLLSRRRDATGEDVSEIEFDPGARLVIDAGFDDFIRANWSSLVDSGGMQFQFPLATEGSLVDLRIEPARCGQGKDGERCFALEPANWLIRLVAGTIELGYDPQTRRLARFSGRSNLPDRNGDGFDVDIFYRYGADDPALCADLPTARDAVSTANAATG